MELLNINLSNIRCDSSHECINFGIPHYIKDGFSKGGVQRIKCGYCGRRMSSKRRSLLPILLKTHRELAKEELYALGLIKALGQFSNANTRLVLTVSPSKRTILEQIKSCLKIDSPIIKTQQERYISFSWQHKEAAPCWSYLGVLEKVIWLPYMYCLEFEQGFKERGC